jgi:hypothetical protein
MADLDRIIRLKTSRTEPKPKSRRTPWNWMRKSDDRDPLG